MIRIPLVRISQTFALAFIAAFAAAPAALAWGCQGHEIVALIAEANLNPKALATANEILKNAVLDPGVTRYCTEDVDAFAQASTWADDIRRVRPEASPWHFIDIPRDANRADIEKYCPQDTGCVLSALRAQLEILKSPNADAKARGDALKFVIHFIGDMHSRCTTWTTTTTAAIASLSRFSALSRSCAIPRRNPIRRIFMACGTRISWCAP